MRKNRTELSTAISSIFVPVLDITDHENFLDGDLKDSLVLRKDVISTDTASTNSYTINFTNCDYFELNCDNRNITVDFSNLNVGEIKYFKLTNYSSVKFAAFRIVNHSHENNIDYLAYCLFRVINKDGLIYIEPFYLSPFGTLFVSTGSFDFLDFEDKLIKIVLSLTLPAVSVSNGPTELSGVSGTIDLHVETEYSGLGRKFIIMSAYDDFGSGNQFMTWLGYMSEIGHSITWTKTFG